MRCGARRRRRTRWPARCISRTPTSRASRSSRRRSSGAAGPRRGSSRGGHDSLDAPARDTLGCEECHGHPTTFRAGSRRSADDVAGPRWEPCAAVRARYRAGSRAARAAPTTPRGRAAVRAPRGVAPGRPPAGGGGAGRRAPLAGRPGGRRHPWVVRVGPRGPGAHRRPLAARHRRVGLERFVQPLAWALAALFVAALVRRAASCERPAARRGGWPAGR